MTSLGGMYTPLIDERVEPDKSEKPEQLMFGNSESEECSGVQISILEETPPPAPRGLQIKPVERDIAKSENLDTNICTKTVKMRSVLECKFRFWNHHQRHEVS